MTFNVQNELFWYIENFEKIWFAKDESDKFVIFDLEYKNFSNILSSDKLNVKNEKVVWKAIRDWVLKDEKRLNHLPNLIKGCLRFGRLSTEFIDDNIFSCGSFMNLKIDDQEDLKFLINDAHNNKNKQITTNGFNVPNSSLTAYFQLRETKSLLICVSDSVEFFDYQLKNWQTSSFELPTKQTNFQLKILKMTGSMLYAFGGIDENKNAINKVWRLDLSQLSSQWTAMTPMKNCRTFFPSVVFNDDIYVFGGKGDNLRNHILNDCEFYDSHRNVWLTIAPIKIARYDASATVYNDCIYVAGGVNENNQIEQSVEKYNPISDCWSKVAPMGTPRRNFALTSFDDRLWAIGGLDDHDQALSTVEYYDQEVDKWWPKAFKLNEGRSFHAAINFRNKLYVIGGCKKVVRNANGELKIIDSVQVVEKYVPGKGWCQNCVHQKAHLNAKLIVVSSAFSTFFKTNSNQQNLKNINAKENSFQNDQTKQTTSEYICCLSSSSDTKFGPQKIKNILVCINRKYGSVKFYDQQCNIWKKSPASLKLPIKQTYFQFELLGDKSNMLYVFGGEDDNSNVINQVWSRDLSQLSSYWVPMAPMNVCRTYFSSVVLNGNIYVLGGWFECDALRSCEKYDCQRNTWSAVAPLNIARCQASAAVYDGHIYIAGGQNEEFENEQSMERYDPQSNTWTLLAPMSTSRCYFALTAFDDRLWATGGLDDNGQALSIVEVYDPETDTWREETELNGGRWGHTAIDFNDQLYVLGDKDGKSWNKNSDTQKRPPFTKLLIVPITYSGVFTSSSFSIGKLPA